MKRSQIFGAVLFITVLSFIISAQTLQQTNHQKFQSDKLSFSYPENWKIVDKSSKQIQQFNLVSDESNALIMIKVFRPKVSTQIDFDRVNSVLTQPLIEKIQKSFISYNNNTSCTKIYNSIIPGFNFTGSYNNEESMSDIYSFAVEGKFINLVYMRSNKESAKTDAVWELIRKTLKVKDKDSDDNFSLILDLRNIGVINTKAVKLIKPMFPSTGKKPLSSTMVEVRVTVDETGKVISADIISGNPSFQPAAIQAAKDSIFKPVYLCGELAKYSGVIQYSFVP